MRGIRGDEDTATAARRHVSTFGSVPVVLPFHNFSSFSSFYWDPGMLGTGAYGLLDHWEHKVRADLIEQR
jgi:hypothetical protein